MKTFKRNIEFFLIVVGIVLVWRGVWGLSDIYIFPEIPTLSFILSIVIGLVILVIHNKRKKDISELL